jgi:hypothetical protein
MLITIQIAHTRCKDRREVSLTILITTTSQKAQDFVWQLYLFPLSFTFWLKRWLYFNKFPQCSNCHQLSYYILKFTNPEAYHWCVKPHSTGDQCCPTATCSVRGHQYAHAIPLYVSHSKPHKLIQALVWSTLSYCPVEGKGKKMKCKR